MINNKSTHENENLNEKKVLNECNIVYTTQSTFKRLILSVIYSIKLWLKNKKSKINNVNVAHQCDEILDRIAKSVTLS